MASRPNLTTLQNTPPWEWPSNADEIIGAAILDRSRDQDERLLAAELAGDFVVVNDDLANLLLEVIQDDRESQEIRARAAISLGPVLEEMDVMEFDDPEDHPISGDTFTTILDTLERLFRDSAVPTLVRRHILEAAVRAPQSWHGDAVRAAYSSTDPDWRLTAVFAMQWIKGFEAEILESLEDEREEIRMWALCAAGNWELSAAWPYVEDVLTSETVDKELLLAAIEAAPSIRPEEVPGLLVDLADSDDEDIAFAVEEALMMAKHLARGTDLTNGQDEPDLW